MNTNYIYETTDINHVAYLSRICGYQIADIKTKINERNGKPILSFVFYESQFAINGALCDYQNGDVAKFNETRNSLLSLIRQSQNKSREEFLEEANQI